jgi:predicted ATPase/DNA-binding winged helix-turn-helix (wHTH) protein
MSSPPNVHRLPAGATHARRDDGGRPYRFGPFELDCADRQLRRDGKPVDLGARGFDLLVALVEEAGRLVTKDDILRRVWRGVVVEESNIQVQVSALRKILGHDAISTVAGHGYRFDLPVQRVTVAIGPTRRVVIPQPLSSLVGRRMEIESVGSLLDANRLVTLKGAGGIGKTRLAVSAAHAIAASFPGDIWFVDLSAQQDGATVPAAVLTAIDAPSDSRTTALESLRRRLHEGPTLLILDNCEQVIDSVATTCRVLLESCPELRLLCTSREPLRVSGEAVFAVPPLSEAEACALFVARAQAASPGFRETGESRPLVETVVHRLDGISLALELAAARLRGMSLKDLARQIDNRFQLLTGGDRTALPRHQALRATMEWSYQLLSPPEQELFRRLGVFSGPFGLADVAAVAYAGNDVSIPVLDLLTGLVDRSLVQSDPGSPEHGYSLFESTRAFAHEELERSGALREACERHFRYYLTRAILAHESRNTPDWTRMRDGLRPIYPNLVAALRWSLAEGNDVERGADLVARLHEVWCDFAWYEDGERWLCLAREHIPRLGRLTAARVLYALGGLYEDMGRLKESASNLTESIALYEGWEEHRGEWAIACNELGVTLVYQADYAGARRMFELALPVHRELGNRQREAQTLNNLAALDVYDDDYATAEPKVLEAIRLCRESGNRQTEATCIAWLAECAYYRGQALEAIGYARRGLELREPLSDTAFVAALRYRIAKYAAAAGDLALARASALEGLRIISVLRSSVAVAECLEVCAELALRMGLAEGGARLVGFATGFRSGIRQAADTPRRQRRLDDFDKRARATLDPAAYDRQLALGAAMETELALARSMVESLPAQPLP